MAIPIVIIDYYSYLFHKCNKPEHIEGDQVALSSFNHFHTSRFKAGARLCAVSDAVSVFSILSNDKGPKVVLMHLFNRPAAHS